MMLSRLSDPLFAPDPGGEKDDKSRKTKASKAVSTDLFNVSGTRSHQKLYVAKESVSLLQLWCRSMNYIEDDRIDFGNVTTNQEKYFASTIRNPT